MAINAIGRAEVEIRADVRKLGKDITDAFDGVTAQADKMAKDIAKPISEKLDDAVNNIKVGIDVDTSSVDAAAREVGLILPGYRYC